MAIKDLLVHLDGFQRSELRLAIACDMAKRFGAHLTAIYIADPIDGGAADVTHAEQRYLAWVQQAGVDGSWRVVNEHAAEAIADGASYADLAIVGQWDPNTAPTHDIDKIPETALLSTGRPVLIIPYAGDFATVGRKVVIAWKKSREAARAIHDALPLLAQATNVKLLTINPEPNSSDEKDSVQRVAEHLERHGVKVTIDRAIFHNVSEANVLVNSASDFAADLIVAGGYSHSRVRERAFGGVTRTLLTEMIAPVLLSH